MKFSFTIRKRQTQTRGIAFDLYYKSVPGKGRKGKVHRPLLGYNLDKGEAKALALEKIQIIQENLSEGRQGPDTNLKWKLEDIVPLYWAAFEIEGRVDHKRPEGILKHQLLPIFGVKSLSALSYQDGVEFILKRKREKANNWTIAREWNLLMRLLNLAIKDEKLDRNRLLGVTVQKGIRRKRVATTDELLDIKEVATEEMWRFVLAALNIVLREGIIFAIDRSWASQRPDGSWLCPPPPRSPLKKHPPVVPLNRIARSALGISNDDFVTGRVWSWKHIRTFTREWEATCERAHIKDLRIHDLRHTGTTKLKGLKVLYEVRQALLGHSMPGETANYSHGSVEWDLLLRDAVERLGLAFSADGVRDKVRDNDEEPTRLIDVDLYNSLNSEDKNGEPRAARTLDPRLKRAMLYQLS